MAEAGGAAMNDDDLLFGSDDIELLKRRQQVGGWAEHQVGMLVARCHAQAAALSKLQARMASAEWAKLDAPIAAHHASVVRPPSHLGQAGRKPRPPV